MAERKGEKMFGKSKFEKVFGFGGRSHVSGMLDMESNKVLAVLHSKAESFSWACKEQEKVLKRDVSSSPTAQAIRERKEDIKGAEELVSKYKKFFWDAHALAKKEGFTVKSNHSDYLTIVR